MKILEANAGALTNFEVLDFLRARGASKDPTRVIAPIAASEYEVYDYLAASPAGNQTKETINEFIEKSKRFNLAKAEVLNIINTRPASVVDIDPVVEQLEERFNEEQIDELVELVKEVLPSVPTATEDEEGADLDNEGTDNQVAEDENREDKEENDDESNTVDEENASVEPSGL